MSTCKTCGAMIEWIAHEGTGKHAPIDVNAIPGGNIETSNNGKQRTYRIVATDPFYIRRTNHFATCPDAQEHRRE